MSLLNKLFKRTYQKDLRDMFTNLSNREELLGIKDIIVPTPEGIKIDATKIRKYTDSEGYNLFAKEAWARIIDDLDKIISLKSTNEERQYRCGAVQRTLDLLRLSYNAKYIIEQWDKEQKDSSRPISRS